MPRTHTEWKRALYPLALAAVRRGDLPARPGDEEHVARIVSDYAAVDMVLAGRTLLLPMDEVDAVDRLECAA